MISIFKSEKIPSEIIQNPKPKISSRLNKTFCYKVSTKTENIKDKINDIPNIFSPNIQSAVELSYNKIEKDIKTYQNLMNIILIY
ncbi:hypothetical protein H8356DRAFT_1330722 [Neocallimastix lanati (nom. inval.)]|nr:hypothetical protein H8356DRAFT_1330722 [Neocallimastix sp. JGI-2020a]